MPVVGRGRRDASPVYLRARIGPHGTRRKPRRRSFDLPAGVPVATMAIGRSGAVNAGLLATSIVSVSRPELRERLRAWRQTRTDEVLAEPDPRS